MGRPTLASIQVATTDRLLRAAEQVFARDGLQGARLADIAQEAGITRASLLYHFETKEALHEAVVEGALGSLAAILASAMQAPGGFRDRVDGVLEAFFTFVDVHPALTRIVVREVIAGNARVAEQARPVLDAVVAFVEREHTRRDLARDARASLMMVVSDTFLRAASAELASPLWGTHVAPRALARRVLLGEENR